MNTEQLLFESISDAGEQLGGATRDFMESRFGADLGDIRIHRSAASDSVNKASESLAYAVDNHIGFKTGFNESCGELYLYVLAHELVHVLQKRRAKHTNKHTLGSTWVLEEEADRIACEVLCGTPRFNGGDPFQVEDLLTGENFVWRDRRNFVMLDPHSRPAHVFRLRRLIGMDGEQLILREGRKIFAHKIAKISKGLRSDFLATELCSDWSEAISKSLRPLYGGDPLGFEEAYRLGLTSPYFGDRTLPCLTDQPVQGNRSDD